MSVLIDQLLHKLDVFTVSMVLITSYTAFIGKKKKIFNVVKRITAFI